MQMRFGLPRCECINELNERNAILYLTSWSSYSKSKKDNASSETRWRRRFSMWVRKVQFFVKGETRFQSTISAKFRVREAWVNHTVLNSILSVIWISSANQGLIKMWPWMGYINRTLFPLHLALGRSNHEPNSLSVKIRSINTFRATV